MCQFHETGSPLLNLINGLSESLQTIPPDELLDDDSRKSFEIEAKALLRSAMEEAKRRRANREVN